MNKGKLNNKDKDQKISTKDKELIDNLDQFKSDFDTYKTCLEQNFGSKANATNQAKIQTIKPCQANNYGVNAVDIFNNQPKEFLFRLAKGNNSNHLTSLTNSSNETVNSLDLQKNSSLQESFLMCPQQKLKFVLPKKVLTINIGEEVNPNKTSSNTDDKDLPANQESCNKSKNSPRFQIQTCLSRNKIEKIVMKLPKEFDNI